MAFAALGLGAGLAYVQRAGSVVQSPKAARERVGSKPRWVRSSRFYISR